MDPTCVWIGLVCFTEVGFDDSASAVRWCVDQRSNRLKVEGKLTMGLPKAQWSNYHEGSAVRWAWRDRSGTKSAFGSLTGSAFGSWLDRRLDRHLVRDEIGVWIGVWFVTKSAFGSLTGSAFGSLTNWRLDRSFSGLLSLLVHWVLSFSGSLSLLRVEGNGLKVKWICKMISGSNEANFGQTEMNFRKFYFP